LLLPMPTGLALTRFDCGGTTATALMPAMSARNAKKPVAQAAIAAANVHSQANGALMRISPLGIFASAFEADDCAITFAREDAILTHPNQVCQDASAIFAATLAFAIRKGASPKETYHRSLEIAETVGAADPVLTCLRAAPTIAPVEFVGSKSGWVLVALQNAFYQLLHATSLEEGVVDTIRRGGDTDTNAAIAGALLGAVLSREQVPKQWLTPLLACRPINGLPGVHRPRPANYWPVDAMALAENLLITGQSAQEKGSR
jgi:ADP-ribosyl-[dinitrogen reductase] hydrolase